MAEIALINAAKTGDVATITKLLDAGTNVNSASRTKNTAAMEACKHDKMDALKLLVARGADVKLKDSGGKTCYYHAADKFSIECAEYLATLPGAREALKEGSTVAHSNPMHLAARGACAAIVKAYAGISDLTSVNEYGMTALGEAMAADQDGAEEAKKCVDILKAAGASDPGPGFEN